MGGESFRGCACEPALLGWPALAVAARGSASVSALRGSAPRCSVGGGGERGRQLSAAAGAMSFCQPAIVAMAVSMDVCHGRVAGERGEMGAGLARARGAEAGMVMALLVL